MEAIPALRSRRASLFGTVEHESFQHVQRVERETLVDLVLSRSYCAVLSPQERAPVLDRVERLFDEHAVEGVLELPYVTECFRAPRRLTGLRRRRARAFGRNRAALRSESAMAVSAP